MICPRCSFLLRRYSRRVASFLRNPPAEYTKAMGYDKDKRKFSKDCDTWLRALKQVCCDERRKRAS